MFRCEYGSTYWFSFAFQITSSRSEKCRIVYCSNKFCHILVLWLHAVRHWTLGHDRTDSDLKSSKMRYRNWLSDLFHLFGRKAWSQFISVPQISLKITRRHQIGKLKNETFQCSLCHQPFDPFLPSDILISLDCVGNIVRLKVERYQNKRYSRF